MINYQIIRFISCLFHIYRQQRRVMTRLTHFNGAFWDADFCGTSGYETLAKKMKDGRQMCKDFLDFLRARVKIEEEYAKSLQKLVKSAGGVTEIGSLKQAFDSLVSETERLSSNHQEAAAALHESTQRLTDFMAAQKSKRAQSEDTQNKANKKKQDSYKKTMDAKKGYHSKCREFENMEAQVSAAKHPSGGGAPMSASAYDKLYTKQDKCRASRDEADSHYHQCVEVLDDARQRWEWDMTAMCDAFQQLEEDRISFLRNEMWYHTNVISQTCVDDDNCCEKVRQVLEKCNVTADVESFIEEKKTGLEKPAAVHYIAYEAQKTGKNAAVKSTNLTHRAAQPIPPDPSRTLPPAMLAPRYKAHPDDGAGKGGSHC